MKRVINYINKTHTVFKTEGGKDYTSTFTFETNSVAEFNELLATAEWVEVADTQPTPLTLAELKAQKIAEINFAFEESMAQVKTGYPQDEILTWSKQESEARAWLADNTAETPLLDAYVVVKSVTKANLVGAIIAKADMFASICGSLVGKRQYLEDVINGATLEGIANISW